MDDNTPDTASNQPPKNSDTTDEIKDEKAQSSAKFTPLFIIGGVGCALILCLALLAGSGLLVYFSSSSASEKVITDTNETTSEPTETETETEISEDSEPETEQAETTSTVNADSSSANTEAEASDSFTSTSDIVTPGASPELGQLTFSQET